MVGKKGNRNDESQKFMSCLLDAIFLLLLGGVIRLLEVKIGRPLHYAICQLHGNELPLRHLFSKLDGSTSGPNSFSGPIGNAIKNNVHH